MDNPSSPTRAATVPVSQPPIASIRKHQLMFRASPWISYEPSEPRNQGSALDHVDTTLQDRAGGGDNMDAPQISILREEETPPPQPTRTSKFRVKLLVNDAKAGASSPGSISRKPTTGRQNDDDEDDDEDEEDQLIDDDDQLNPASLSLGSKRKTSHKRKPKKTEKRIAEDERKNREKIHMPAESHLNQETPSGDVSSGVPSGDHVTLPEPHHPNVPIKKGAAQRSKAKMTSKAIKDSALPTLEEGGNFSETYTGTAASSPVTFHPECSPEPDSFGPIATVPSTEDVNLDSTPLPIYPLPSKPFPVQPPPKIGTGFAPIIPLDKTHKHVRHWRIANREIRGIAGGRWFTHSWVGEKESEFASIATAPTASGKAVDGVALPKLSSVSISAPPSGKGSSKLRVQGVVSATHSRASSTIPDAHATRAPTRMRSMLAGPASEGGNDSEMAVLGP